MTTKEFAKKWFGAIDATDFSTLQSLLADNHKFSVSASPSPEALDKEGHIGLVKAMSGGFSNAQHTFEQFISEGDWIVVRGRWSGTHSGEFNGIPASGKKVDFPFIDIMHIVNGKLAEEYMEWNALTLMMQIGAIPQPA